MDSISRLKEIADAECECTEDQSTGKDPSFCNSCCAGNALARIVEAADWELAIIGEII